MKIEHISYSSSGGAGRVAECLSTAMENLGYEASLNVATSTNLTLDSFLSPKTTLSAGFDNFILGNPAFKSQLSITRSKLSLLSITPDAEIVNLHWIEGVISLNQIQKAIESGKKIFWTLHDMRPFTGACHYSLGCQGFETGCRKCPQVRFFAKKSVEFAFQVKQNLKQVVYSQINFICPSTWIADNLHRSGLVENDRIRVITNPVDSNFFLISNPKETSSHSGDINYVAIASDLSDPRKNIKSLLREFEKIALPYETLTLVGKNGEAFEDLNGNIRWVGEASKSELISHIDSSSALIHVANEDNSPLVISESIARGVPAIVLRRGGAGESPTPGIIQIDNLSDLKNVLQVFRSSSVEKLCESQKSLQNYAASTYSPEIVAKKYIEYYAE